MRDKTGKIVNKRIKLQKYINIDQTIVAIFHAWADFLLVLSFASWETYNTFLFKDRYMVGMFNLFSDYGFHP